MILVSLKDIVDEMDAITDEHSAFLNIQTGELVVLSTEALSAAEEDDDAGDYPEWEQELIIKAREVIASDDYLELPGKFDIHEYRIMEEFCYSVEADEIREDLLARIRGRGAFRRFKDAILRHGIREKWYLFREEELEKIAVDWLDAHRIPYTRDKRVETP